MLRILEMKKVYRVPLILLASIENLGVKVLGSLEDRNLFHIFHKIYIKTRIIIMKI